MKGKASSVRGDVGILPVPKSSTPIQAGDRFYLNTLTPTGRGEAEPPLVQKLPPVIL